MPDSRRIRNAASGKRQKYNGEKIPSDSLRRDFVLRGRVQGSRFKVQGSGFRGEAAHFVILSGEIKNGLSEIGELSRRI